MVLPLRFDAAELSRLQERLRALPRRRLFEAEKEFAAEKESGAEKRVGTGQGKARREAAVLVSLCDQKGEPSVLFTKRSDTVGTHKGQVSFPGGMTDDDDAGPEDTALRELAEEVGLARESVKILGRFHEAEAITGVKVVPVIGYLGEVSIDDLKVSEAEIDHVFALTFAELLDEKQRYEQVLGERGPHPVFDAGPYPVWGLTAWILREVLEDLFDLKLIPGSATPKQQNFHRP